MIYNVEGNWPRSALDELETRRSLLELSYIRDFAVGSGLQVRDIRADLGN